ncbi:MULTISPECIES: hypothetical protein [Arthrobacter]|uniref:hypothetical protein n=1 Tax=Arthrobacter TaxID=1663 RepID=UPI0011B6ED8F|nr:MULTISPECIES: hypothetical protein [Arthrobacter]NYG18908.1 hypothetical protein [Arthrobacter psychrochitiniphilus]
MPPEQDYGDKLAGVSHIPKATRRFEMTLSKPKLGWYPRPTVVVSGDAQPAQWGTRNWKVPEAQELTVTVFLFNRLWKYGEASFVLRPGADGPFYYRAPWLPFGQGRINNASAALRN